MIKFELQNIELLDNILLSEIDSVYLSMYVLFSDVYVPKVCSLHTVDYEWEEMEVTWLQASNTQEWYMVPQTGNDDTFAIEGAGDMDIDPIATTNHAQMEEWQNWNVTEIIKTYIENANENHGFIVRSGAELQPHFYYSSEHDSLNLRPKLTFFTNGVKINKNNKKYLYSLPFEIKKLGSSIYINFIKKDAANLELFNTKGRLIYSMYINHAVDTKIELGENATGYFYGRIKSGDENFQFSIINNF